MFGIFWYRVGLHFLILSETNSRRIPVASSRLTFLFVSFQRCLGIPMFAVHQGFGTTNRYSRPVFWFIWWSTKRFHPSTTLFKSARCNCPDIANFTLPLGSSANRICRRIRNASFWCALMESGMSLALPWRKLQVDISPCVGMSEGLMEILRSERWQMIYLIDIWWTWMYTSCYRHQYKPTWTNVTCVSNSHPVW